MEKSVYEVEVLDIKGHPTLLSRYSGQVMLIVNVASKCGLTKQYEGLQKLYQEYLKMGLVILGFPSNDFHGQEPGTEQEILEFCSLKYNVTFPLFAKIPVKGVNQHPLFRLLTTSVPRCVTPENSNFEQKLTESGHEKSEPHEILWNFEKFLVGRTGLVSGRFSPDMKPDDPVLLKAVEKALGFLN
ncbi:glutathione peroxidase [bacterium]|nr:glutathione peroxidase [bacterium]